MAVGFLFNSENVTIGVVKIEDGGGRDFHSLACTPDKVAGAGARSMIFTEIIGKTAKDAGSVERFFSELLY